MITDIISANIVGREDKTVFAIGKNLSDMSCMPCINFFCGQIMVKITKKYYEKKLLANLEPNFAKFCKLVILIRKLKIFSFKFKKR